jgi:hypothetical protein
MRKIGQIEALAPLGGRPAEPILRAEKAMNAFTVLRRGRYVEQKFLYNGGTLHRRACDAVASSPGVPFNASAIAGRAGEQPY